MSSENERRLHPRYPLRLAVELRRGGQELGAHIINASKGGCLLLLGLPLEPGEIVEASIPELMLSRARLRVLRCQSEPSGYTVATCFEPAAVSNDPLVQGSAEQSSSGTPWLN